MRFRREKGRESEDLSIIKKVIRVLARKGMQSTSVLAEKFLEELEEGSSKIREVIETMELILRLCENIAGDPLAEKYRKVKYVNPKIKSVIFDRWPNANKFFEALGFIRDETS